MPRIENTTNPYTPPEDAICLTKNGWGPTPEEVQIQLQPGLPLPEALDLLWAQHKGLLGNGELVFACTTMQPLATGYIVFIPKGDDA